MESPGAHETEGFVWPFLLGAVFFQTSLPCSGGYHQARGGMPLHDVVKINCEKGETTETRGASAWAKGRLLGDCMLSGMTTPPCGGRKSWYIVLLFNSRGTVNGL